ncbi:MAG: dihydropteroate synthase [Vampirovibrionales bacterium]|nr:dihydropteroate synthase [Vampirovibrionales bacterium]
MSLTGQPFASDQGGVARILAVLNLTPDSFSDGGRWTGAPVSQIVDAAGQLLTEGADALDIGGESTRPGAATISPEAECERILPAIAALHAAFPQTPLSVDTRKAQVAAEAVKAGASVINDVSGLQFDPLMARTAATSGATLILMHSQGEPATMQQNPQYGDVVAEVGAFLAAQADAAIAAGVARERIWLDPGFGFGKTRAHNLALLRHLSDIVALGFPVLAGLSRKTFLSPLDDQGRAALAPGERDALSAAAAALALHAGARMIRLHNVKLHHPVVHWMGALLA